MRTSVLVALFLGIVSSASAQVAGPSASVVTGSTYRLIVELSPANADTMLRFPKLTVGSNSCLAAGLPEQYTAIKWAHIRNIRGNATLRAVLYSSCYPLGRDTVACTGNVRGVTVGGCVIDSIKVLDSTSGQPDSAIVYVTD